VSGIVQLLYFGFSCNTGTTSTQFLSLPYLHKCADKKLIHYHYVTRCVEHFSCNVGGLYGNVYSCYGFWVITLWSLIVGKQCAALSPI